MWKPGILKCNIGNSQKFAFINNILSVFSIEINPVFPKGVSSDEFSLTSTPRRSPAAVSTPGTPAALVSMAREQTEALEAKAALRQVTLIQIYFICHQMCERSGFDTASPLGSHMLY